MRVCLYLLATFLFILLRHVDAQEYYFWNEVTGDVQWEDPGGVPYIVNGKRTWYDAEGNALEEDPKAMEYLWVESFSEEHGRPFFFNQKTQSSTWERPADLSWRRVAVAEVDNEL